MKGSVKVVNMNVQLVLLKLVNLFYISLAANDLSFIGNANTTCSSLTAVVTTTSSNQRMCSMKCLTNPTCVSFSYQSEEESRCPLYNAFLLSPENQLQTQEGYDFHNLALTNTISKPTVVMSRVSSVNMMAFPNLKTPVSGHVVGWRMRSEKTCGVIVLAMWRRVTSTTQKLVGRTHVNVSYIIDAGDDVTYYHVPRSEWFLVQENDFIGMHRVSAPDLNPNVYCLHENQGRDGFSLSDFEVTFGSTLTDEDISVGQVYSASGWYKRLPAIGVIIM